MEDYYFNKRKSYTIKDKLCVINLILEDGLDLKTIAKHYKISITNIYNWIRKYDKILKCS